MIAANVLLRQEGKQTRVCFIEVKTQETALLLAFVCSDMDARLSRCTQDLRSTAGSAQEAFECISREAAA